MESAEDSTIADVRLAIKDLGIEKDFREIKGLIKNIRTGSTITFKGIRSTGTQTAKLKSLSGITTLVIEEAEEVESFKEFSKIDESIRTAGKPLKVILIYNPTSSVSSWIHKEWFKNGLPRKDRLHDTMYIHSTFLDNLDNLAESTVKRYKDLEKLNPLYYENTILAKWTLEEQGHVYGGWGHYPYFEEEGDIWYGLDFGYGGKDKTACVKINYYDGCYYVEQMFSEQLTIRKTISKMRECGIKFNSIIFADSAVPELISQIREGGFTSIRNATKGNKEAGIKKIQDKDITIVGADDETDLYYEYITFSRDDLGKLPHEPDILAAVRYAINSRKPLDVKEQIPLRRIRKKNGFLSN